MAVRTQYIYQVITTSVCMQIIWFFYTVMFDSYMFFFRPCNYIFSSFVHSQERTQPTGWRTTAPSLGRGVWEGAWPTSRPPHTPWVWPWDTTHPWITQCTHQYHTHQVSMLVLSFILYQTYFVNHSCLMNHKSSVFILKSLEDWCMRYEQTFIV